MPHVRARLSSSEFADAAVLGALAAVLVAVGKLLPQIGAVEWFAILPFGLLGTLPRLRAAVCGAIAGGMIAVLVAGLGAGTEVVGLAAIGGFAGWVIRSGRGVGTVVGGGLVGGLLLGTVADVALLVLVAARDLAFASVRGVADGAAIAVRGVPALAWAGALLRDLTRAVLGSWWVWVPVAGLIGVTAGMVLVWIVLRDLLVRLPKANRTPLGLVRPVEGPADPLPVVLQRAWLDGAGTDGSGLDLTVGPAEFVVVTGANGAGKSTLLQLLAGTPAATGAVDRPGGVGLGRMGGTALLLQRPETQVLGVTVAEDLRWGLPHTVRLDVPALLDEVGLAGTADRPTAGLSGGQLQRLALAAALARRPALLLSDESTAMIDEDGRPELLELLASLPRRRGTTVVHVSHFPDEALRADRQIVLDAGRVVHDGPPLPSLPRPLRRPTPPAHAAGDAILRAEDVGVVRAPGTPWEHVVLRHVDLELAAGGGLRLSGPNGSGKSTLAGVLAGLERPTSGRSLVDGDPADRSLGRVGIVFQHARLQVQRPTVGADIVAAAGAAVARDEAAAFAAPWLEAVALDPALAAVRVDDLSGGQLRRVALAGVLASRPRVLLLDEPFAGLDPESRDVLVNTLIAVRQGGTALLVITHDAVDGLWDRTVELQEGVLR